MPSWLVASGIMVVGATVWLIVARLLRHPAYDEGAAALKRLRRQFAGAAGVAQG
jgi:hypothetical protein